MDSYELPILVGFITIFPWHASLESQKICPEDRERHHVDGPDAGAALLRRFRLRFRLRWAVDTFLGLVPKR